MVNYDQLPAASQFFNGKLYETMRDDLQLAGRSKRTVHGYLRAVRQFADYCQRRPNRITESQLRQFFLHLKNEKNFAYGSIRVAFSGIPVFCFPPKGETTGSLPRLKRPFRRVPCRKR